MEYTVQNLEYAVSVFYNSEQEERAQAHEWLTTAQRCPEAWSFVWELLQPTKGTEVQFFAATTLHTKLLRCWPEVPPQNHEELKDKILHTVLTYSNGPKIVLNRLCISLAAFILQQGNVDLATILRPLSSAENTSLLLEVLTVIPEEFNSMTMGSVLRTKNLIMLQQACPAVLDDMMRYLQSSYSEKAPTEHTTQTWCSAALCASSWLSLGCDEYSVREQGVAANLADRIPLCLALLNVVHTLYTHHEIISDTALDACEAALKAVRVAGASPDAERSPTAALELISALASLATPIFAKDNVPNSINEELLAALTTCAVSLGECHTRALASAALRDVGVVVGISADARPAAAEGARALLQLLLGAQAAAGHYPLHETRSQLVFGFWYTLQDEVLYLSETMTVIHDLWRSLFTQLLNILIAKCEMPAESALSRDDAELLRCYRQDVADTVMYCYSILGETSWSVVTDAYTHATGSSRREAALHAAAALGDTGVRVAAPERMVRAAVEEAQTAGDVRLLHTALECLGAYSGWLESRGELAAAAVRAAGRALGAAPAPAALALRKLSVDCGGVCAPLAAEICMAAQSAQRSSPWVRRQLVAAAGAALGADVEGERDRDGGAGGRDRDGGGRDRDGGGRDRDGGAGAAERARLLDGLAVGLRDDLMVQSPRTENGAAEATAALLGALPTRPELAVRLVSTLRPALVTLAARPDSGASLFLILKQAISVLLDDCLPFINEMAQLTIQANELEPSAAGLDVVKLMVLLFNNQWPGCKDLFIATIRGAAAAVAADMAGRPDLTDALFSTLQAVTKKKFTLVDSLGDLLPQLVDLGCTAIRLWVGGRSACAWLASLAMSCPSAVRHAAPELVGAACAAIGGTTPRNQVEPLAELLLGLNRAVWAPPQAGPGAPGLASWLQRALADAGFPTPHASADHKDKFINNVLKEKSSKRRLLETVREFSLACRGLIGTEYARQTLASQQLLS